MRYVKVEQNALCHDIVPTITYSIEQMLEGHVYHEDSNPNQAFMLLGTDRDQRQDTLAKRVLNLVAQ